MLREIEVLLRWRGRRGGMLEDVMDLLRGLEGRRLLKESTMRSRETTLSNGRIRWSEER